MSKALRHTFHRLPDPVQSMVRSVAPFVAKTSTGVITAVHRLALTRFNLAKNASRMDRKLEIGPGPDRIDGFETLNVVGATNVDYVADASKRLPFDDDTFECIYASHILEHIPWYQTGDVLKEWVRILKPGGSLEVWVPDGLKIAKTFVDAEAGDSRIDQDGWYKFNDERDPCVWAAGRIFSYGGGDGKKNHPNWHMAIFSPRHLQALFEGAGLAEVSRLSIESVRGYDHGWINLGLTGKKKGHPAGDPSLEVS